MMISQRQLTANQQNALKSTGPRTKQGKARSSKNAMTHGLLSQQVVLSTESKRVFNRFRKNMLEALAPVNEMELLLADLAIVTAWRLRRVMQIQLENLEGAIEEKRTELRNKQIEDAVKKEIGTPTWLSRGWSAEQWEQYREIWDRIPEQPLDALSTVMDKQLTEFDFHETLHRYEVSYERSMYRALRELQRMQASRKGQPVLAPLAVDVDVRAMGSGPN